MPSPFEYPVERNLTSVILSNTDLVSKQNYGVIDQCNLLKKLKKLNSNCGTIVQDP